MPRRKQIGSAEASTPVPQGHNSLSSALPSPSPSEASRDAPQRQSDYSSPGGICLELMFRQRRRCFAITMQSRCDRAVEAYIRVQLGYRTDMGEAERTRLSKLSRVIKAAIEDGAEITGEHAAVAERSRGIVACNRTGRKGWDRLRGDTENEMRRLARMLPVWPFVEAVSGVSDLGLAVIVGEAGDLGAYPDEPHKDGPGALCKRLGMAVLGGNRQGNPGRDATAEDWVAHGYSKKRRAQIWAMLDDVMLRQQWQGGAAKGPYGAAYARKKAEYLAREWTAGHADKAARRYMAKMFVRDLWKAWRRADSRLPERAEPLVPSAALADAAE